MALRQEQEHGGEEGCCLRVYMGETDHAGQRPAYEQLVRLAHDRGLAGATVFRSPMGYGTHSQVHTAKVLNLSADLPVVVEIVDVRRKIEDFLPVFRSHLPLQFAVILPVAIVPRAGEAAP